MCTLIVLQGISERWPLIVAANRDERPERPTDGPAFITPTVFAPRELLFGGTWLGMNTHGLFAALTNRAWRLRVPNRRSRGLLVTDSPAQPTLDQATDAIMALPAGAHNGFHLLLADGRRLNLLWSDGDEITATPLADGIHVITGEGYRPRHSPRAGNILTVMAQTIGNQGLSWEFFAGLLSFHGGGPEDGTCVHGPDVSHESIFSAVVRRPWSGNRWEMRWREGRPCAGGTWQETRVPIIEGSVP